MFDLCFRKDIFKVYSRCIRKGKRLDKTTELFVAVIIQEGDKEGLN